VIIFEPEVFGDSRGYFFESFREDVFVEHAGPVTFVQDYQSKSSYGVLRGLHYKKPPSGCSFYRNQLSVTKLSGKHITTQLKKYSIVTQITLLIQIGIETRHLTRIVMFKSCTAYK
jgi:dTDP-4-dehydrorhamnose 3,5-epimerase-like enzyme